MLWAAYGGVYGGPGAGAGGPGVGAGGPGAGVGGLGGAGLGEGGLGVGGLGEGGLGVGAGGAGGLGPGGEGVRPQRIMQTMLFWSQLMTQSGRSGPLPMHPKAQLITVVTHPIMHCIIPSSSRSACLSVTGCASMGLAAT